MVVVLGEMRGRTHGGAGRANEPIISTRFLNFVIKREGSTKLRNMHVNVLYACECAICI